MANGITRLANAEMYKGKIAKGRKALAAQLEENFNPKKIAALKPENFPKKKAKK